MIKRIVKSAQAHCDIPCGIYETETLQTAVATCAKLVKTGLEISQSGLKEVETQNQFIRLVGQKELQAQICKEQIYILWSDFFKSPDFANNPNLGKILWQTAKAASQVKQELSLESIEKLEKSSQEVVELFEKTKAQRN